MEPIREVEEETDPITQILKELWCIYPAKSLIYMHPNKFWAIIYFYNCQKWSFLKKHQSS